MKTPTFQNNVCSSEASSDKKTDFMQHYFWNCGYPLQHVLCTLTAPERCGDEWSQKSRNNNLCYMFNVFFNGFVYLISFIPRLSTLPSFSWGPLCRHRCSHMNTHTVHAYLHLYPHSVNWAGQLLSESPLSILYRCELWERILTGVKWKGTISPWSLLLANFGCGCSKTQTAIVLL